MIGSCDNCDRQNVPVSNGEFCGCETTQCFICQGDVADPYGELEAPSLLVVTGNVEQIRDLLCGPQQHNEHTKGWRWHLYMQDSRMRDAAMREEARKIIAAQEIHNERLTGNVAGLAEVRAA